MNKAEINELTGTEIEDAALEKELKEALTQADRLIDFSNLMPKPSTENIRRANLDLTRGEKLAWFGRT